MQDYEFVIKLNGVVSAESEKDAVEKINAHLDDLGKIESKQHDLHWPDAEWEINEREMV